MPFRRTGIVLCLGFLLPLQATAGPSVGKEEFQAAFCLHVAQFIRWPDVSSKPMRIGVWRSPGTFRSLSRYVATRTLQQRPLMAIDLRDAEGAKDCDLVFIEGDPDKILSVVKDSPIMTIGVNPKFLEHGGILQIVPVERRMAFKINWEAAQKHHLRLGAQLMSLALNRENIPTRPGSGIGGEP